MQAICVHVCESRLSPLEYLKCVMLSCCQTLRLAGPCRIEEARNDKFEQAEHGNG